MSLERYTLSTNFKGDTETWEKHSSSVECKDDKATMKPSRGVRNQLRFVKT
jgi:hypothetical protein